MSPDPNCWQANLGNFVTSLDVAGCPVTVSMLDREMKRLPDAPIDTPAAHAGRSGLPRSSRRNSLRSPNISAG